MWKLYTFVILSVCAATATSQSECNVADINVCINSFADSLGNGTESNGEICSTASSFVMCLNRLISCMDNPTFTQARQLMETMNLDTICPKLNVLPYSSSVGTPAITTASLLVTLLMICIFT